MSRLLTGAALVLSTLSLYVEGVIEPIGIEHYFLVPFALYLLIGKGAIVQNVLITVSSIFLTVSVCDFAMRPFMGQLHYQPFNAYTRRLPQLPTMGRWDPGVDVVSNGYGDLAAMTGDPTFREWRQIQFQTDELGFRNHSRPDKIDLLILGDSFGAGGGTTQNKMFSSVLESKYGIPTYNLSYPGGPYDEFVNFAHESPKLRFSPHATIVWAWYTGNDLPDSTGEFVGIDQLPWNTKLQAWLVQYHTYRNRSPLKQWWQIIQGERTSTDGNVVVRRLPTGEPFLFLRSQEEWAAQSRQAVEQHPNFIKIKRSLEVMKALTLKQGLNLVVLILPTKGEVYPWILASQKASIEDAHPSGFALATLAGCEASHVECHDTKPYLLEQGRRLYASSGKLLWWRDDTHLGEEGHAAVAEFVASILRREGKAKI